MALQNTDLLIIERAGVQYRMSADQIADFVGAVNDVSVADITARDALTDVNVGDRVFVVDATGDATVDAGWAIYRVAQTALPPITYDKIQEQESMDVTIVTTVNLAAVVAPASVTITNDAGDNAVIPLADGTNAGLMSPAQFNNSHAAATAGLTAASNPVNVSAGQAVTFGITQLTPLP